MGAMNRIAVGHHPLTACARFPLPPRTPRRARRLLDGRLVVVKEIKTTTLTPKQKVGQAPFFPRVGRGKMAKRGRSLGRHEWQRIGLGGGRKKGPVIAGAECRAGWGSCDAMPGWCTHVIPI